mmetsp:Transcript_33693/g.39608  ORF Transcript_33693/g.39608 Transcript_33693/m.39608 type:complete len:327 (-) Transcript_33693:288-1268(-)
MHLSKDFKPPGVSDRLRFQSTAQMAMADTGSKYDGLESPSERMRMLNERKLGNTKTSIHLGFESNNQYETSMQAGNNYDRNFQDKIAGGDGGGAMTPHEMKMKLSSANWNFGDADRDWKRASTLNDPTGELFQSYRGILNEEVRDAIKQSSLYFGKDNNGNDNGEAYSTTAKESMKLKTNEIDYAGDYQRAKQMKQALTTSSINLSSDEIRGPEDYISVSQSTMVYDRSQARNAQGVMNAEMKKDLRAQHFKLGYNGNGSYETNEKERQRKLGESMSRRRSELLSTMGGDEDPDLMALKEDRLRTKNLKQTLLQTSIVIGDDKEYF